MLFNVGDIVSAYANSHYGITHENSLCQVVRYRDDEVMDVRRVWPPVTNDRFIVDPARFYRVTDILNFIENRTTGNASEEMERMLGTLPIKINNEGGSNMVMDQTKTYNLPEEMRTKLIAQGRTLLETYDYATSDDGVGAIIDRWAQNKGWIINILRNHPNWDEEKMMIVFSHDWHRERNQSEVENFVCWCKEKIDEIVPMEEVRVSGMLYREVREAYSTVSCTYNDVTYLHDLKDAVLYLKPTAFAAAKEEMERISKIYQQFDSADKKRIGYCVYSRADYEKRKACAEFLNEIERHESHLADTSLATRLNAIAKKAGVDLRFAARQKISRIVSKFAHAIGLDKVKEIGPDRNGVDRDYGWNYKFAMFADAVNPLTYVRHTIISVNPIDYWTMSFGNSWSSCHTIDKTNKRKVDTEHNYHGMYSAGTQSYMQDGASIIMYTVRAEYDGRDFEQQDKMTRCMFHIGNDKMIQGRVYPDGRSDDGDKSLSTQFREVMQMVLAQCLETPNLWTVKKGTKECESVTDSYGQHFRDYENYDDCTVSYLKHDDGSLNYAYIQIGDDTICPNCGKTHGAQDNIVCGRCIAPIRFAF